MEIRSLDNPSDHLSLKIDSQGDIYVTIIHYGESYKEGRTETVRIGGPSSGHQIPTCIHALLHALAVEFGKYDNIQFEDAAAHAEDISEEMKDLEGKIGSVKNDAAPFAGNGEMLRTLRNRLDALNAQYNAVISRSELFPDISPECFVSLCNSKREQQNFHKNEERRMCEERNALANKYAEQALAKSSYKIGQPYTDSNGKLWYVSGAYTSTIHPDGQVCLTFNFAKKDGSMSKVSAFGKGMPRVRIK